LRWTSFDYIPFTGLLDTHNRSSKWIILIYGYQIGIFCGHNEIVVAALAAGANGAILASANLIPDIWQEIYQLIKRGDLAAAQNLQG